MFKESVVCVIKCLVVEIEVVVEKVLVIVYDINNYIKLGVIYYFLEDIID